MPEFDDHATASAPMEEIWKLLVDPTRYPEWWAGIARVDGAAAPGAFDLFHHDEPDRPWPQRVESQDGALIVSCLTSAMRYDWQLEPVGGGTRVGVHVEIPPDWASHLESQRSLIRESIRRLVALAES